LDPVPVAYDGAELGGSVDVVFVGRTLPVFERLDGTETVPLNEPVLLGPVGTEVGIIPLDEVVLLGAVDIEVGSILEDEGVEDVPLDEAVLLGPVGIEVRTVAEDEEMEVVPIDNAVLLVLVDKEVGIVTGDERIELVVWEIPDSVNTEVAEPEIKVPLLELVVWDRPDADNTEVVEPKLGWEVLVVAADDMALELLLALEPSDIEGVDETVELETATEDVEVVSTPELCIEIGVVGPDPNGMQTSGKE